MLEVLKNTDNALIDQLFQPSVQRITDRFQVDCFQQARICTSVAAFVWIVPQTQGLAAMMGTKFLALQLFQATLILLVLSAILTLHAVFRGVKSGHRNAANPLRASMFTHRIGALLGLAVSAGQAAMGTASLSSPALCLCVAVSTYVGACSPPPPRRRDQSQPNWASDLSPQLISQRVDRQAIGRIRRFWRRPDPPSPPVRAADTRVADSALTEPAAGI